MEKSQKRHERARNSENGETLCLCANIIFFSKNQCFLQKVGKSIRFLICSIGGLFPPFQGHINDNNPTEVIELCQNHPWDPHNQKIRKMQPTLPESTFKQICVFFFVNHFFLVKVRKYMKRSFAQLGAHFSPFFWRISVCNPLEVIELCPLRPPESKNSPVYRKVLFIK